MFNLDRPQRRDDVRHGRHEGEPSVEVVNLFPLSLAVRQNKLPCLCLASIYNYEPTWSTSSQETTDRFLTILKILDLVENTCQGQEQHLIKTELQLWSKLATPDIRL